MTTHRTVLAALPIALLAGSIGALGLEGALSPLPTGARLTAIDNRSSWLNSEPLRSADLEGKVVLVSFWTYSCVNWIRTQPYLRAWSEKYHDDGLIVIGVHTPEFGFEKDLDNVRWAAESLGVEYPVVVDNDYAIWDAFSNRYWPAFYFIDASGRLRETKFGEGDYERSERIIRQLLVEAGANPTNDAAHVAPAGLEVAADWDSLETPETYVGYARTAGFDSPERLRSGEPHSYTAPENLDLNRWALMGNWTVQREAATANEVGASIVFRFHARDLNLVMGPAHAGSSVRFRVLLDGQPVGGAGGTDVDEDGYGTVIEQRLYQLVRQSGHIDEREFQIEFLEAGAEAFSFTFG